MRPPERSRWKTAARIGLPALGLALLIWLFATVGWSAIRANLAAIGLWFPALVLLYFFAQAAFALSWWETIEPRPRAGLLARVFAVYLAGDTVNYLLPAGIAGEPVKAHLLRDRVGLPAGIASLTVHKHADMLGQWLFVACGLGVALYRFEVPPAVAWTAGAGVGLLLLFFVALTWALARGSFSPIVTKLSGISFLEKHLAPHLVEAEQLDRRIHTFFSRHAGRYAAAVAWSLVGWCGGLVETWIVLKLLSSRADFATAFAIEALAMLLNTMFIWMPGRVGTAEGVRVGVFVLLGLPAAQGAAYSLVRRARELLWAVPGATVLASSQSSAEPAREEAA
jgi:uncharacterized protein (TIRG00374 family)